MRLTPSVAAAASLALIPLFTQTLASPADVSLPERDNLEHREAAPLVDAVWEEARSIREALSLRDADPDLFSRNSLEKRRGGGGGGRGGGGSSSSSSGGRGGSSSSGGSGSSGSGGRSSSSSSSSAPSYGGGRYYGGGSTSAYSAGSRSPSGIYPGALIGGAALGFGAGALLWPYGAYIYPWGTRYPYHNSSANTNQSLPVECLCSPDQACGCDDTGNTTYLDSVILPNGTSANDSVATVQLVNGTQTVLLNGSLPNGTDDDTGDDSAAVRSVHVQTGGYAVMGVGMVVSLLLL